MKQEAVLYRCGKCGREYQLSSGVEVVNRFAWIKWVKKVSRQCIGCRKEAETK